MDEFEKYANRDDCVLNVEDSVITADFPSFRREYACNHSRMSQFAPVIKIDNETYRLNVRIKRETNGK